MIEAVKEQPEVKEYAVARARHARDRIADALAFAKARVVSIQEAIWSQRYWHEEALVRLTKVKEELKEAETILKDKESADE